MSLQPWFPCPNRLLKVDLVLINQQLLADAVLIPMVTADVAMMGHA